jgi:hypothetical protein
VSGLYALETEVLLQALNVKDAPVRILNSDLFKQPRYCVCHSHLN